MKRSELIAVWELSRDTYAVGDIGCVDPEEIAERLGIPLEDDPVVKESLTTAAESKMP